jgi:hypothetical protein
MSSSEPTPVLDAASQRAMERVYPRGDGTQWCLVERACGEGEGSHFNMYRFEMNINGKDRVPLCLDIIPCDESTCGGDRLTLVEEALGAFRGRNDAVLLERLLRLEACERGLTREPNEH